MMYRTRFKYFRLFFVTFKIEIKIDSISNLFSLEAEQKCQRRKLSRVCEELEGNEKAT